MSATTSFSVYAIDIDDTERVSWNYTTLIESISILLLSVSLVHEALRDVVALVDESVGLVFDSKLFFF